VALETKVTALETALTSLTTQFATINRKCLEEDSGRRLPVAAAATVPCIDDGIGSSSDTTIASAPSSTDQKLSYDLSTSTTIFTKINVNLVPLILMMMM